MSGLRLWRQHSCRAARPHGLGNLKWADDRILYADEGTKGPFDRVHAFLEV
jgi:hypothetical protein